MLPNVRLLIAAMFASIVALSCGFGVYAALRVNRDPLSRLPTGGTTALQLVSNQAAVAAASWGAPFSSGLRPGEAQTGGATSGTPAPGRRGAGAISNLANAWTAGAVTPEAASEPALMPAVQSTPPQSTPQLAMTPPPAPTEPAAITIVAGPTIPPARAAAAPVSTAPLASTPVALVPPTPAAASQALEPALKVKKAAEGEPPISTVPAVAATEPTLDSAPPAAQPAAITGTVPDAAAPEIKASKPFTHKPEPTTPRDLARRPIERRQVAARRRVARRAPASAVARFGGNSTFSAPVFESAPDAYRGPPATSRRGTRRTAKNAAPSDAVAWPSAE